ncbi:MAG: ATPase [Tannerella sp.]|jgi:N-acetylglucosamine kinase-like BadF-type ATPase|nr:ATPase [Tannerella sp.]
MILLADGGSTKVDWRVVENGKEIKQVFTKGANPFFRTREDISEELKAALYPEIKEFTFNSVHFFGAGCANPEKNDVVRKAIADHIQTSEIEVDTDMLGAARGLCGHEKGIACIIGTGSNSCYYDGNRMVENVSPLGYILGDEGSGAVLGRLFVGSLLKNQLTKGLKEQFLQEYGLTPADIIEKVYRQPLVNRFLAGFAPFIRKNIVDKSVENIVYHSFIDFYKRNAMQYDFNQNIIHFTGSVAYHFQDILRRAGEDLGLKIGKIDPSPMEGLIRFYEVY